MLAILSDTTRSLFTNIINMYSIKEVDLERKIDFLLVESLIARDYLDEINTIKARNIPSVLWFTSSFIDVANDSVLLEIFDFVIVSEAKYLGQMIEKLEPLGKKVTLIPPGFNPCFHNPLDRNTYTGGVLHYSPLSLNGYTNESIKRFSSFTREALLSFLAHDLKIYADDEMLSLYPEYAGDFVVDKQKLAEEFNKSSIISFFGNSTNNQTCIPHEVLAAIAQNKLVSIPNCGAVNKMLGMLVYSGSSKKQTAYWLDTISKNKLWTRRIISQAHRIVMNEYSSQSILRKMYKFITGKSLAETKISVISFCNSETEIENIVRYYSIQTYPEKDLTIVCSSGVNKPEEKKDIRCIAVEDLSSESLADVIKSEMFTIFDPENAYGHEYVSDLMNSRSYTVCDGYLKSQSYQANDLQIVEGAEDEYIVVNSTELTRGIFRTDKFKHIRFLTLLSLRVEGKFQVIDGQQFVYKGNILPMEQIERFFDTTESDDLPKLNEITAEIREATELNKLAVDIAEERVNYFPLDVYDGNNNANFNRDKNSLICKSDVPGKINYYCPNNYSTTSFATTPIDIPELFKWTNVNGCTFQLEVKGEKIGEVDASVMFVFYDHEKQIHQTQVYLNDSVVTGLPPGTVCGVPLVRVVGQGECKITEVKITIYPYVEIPILWFADSHDDVIINEESIELSLELEEGKHIYLRPLEYRNSPFSLPPAKNLLSDLHKGEYYELEVDGIVSSELQVDVILLYYDAEKQIGRSNFSIGKKGVFFIDANVEKIAPVIRIAGSGKFLINKIKIRSADELVNFHGNNVLPEERYLLVTNNYPSNNDIYANMFVHRRVVSYLAEKMNVCVFKNLNQRSGDFSTYSYEGVNVFSGNTEELKLFIQMYKPSKILVHFMSKNILSALETAAPQIPVLVWMHGAEVYPITSRLFNYKNYNKAASDLNSSLQRVDAIAEMFNKKNYTFIPVSNTFRHDIEEVYDIKLEETSHPTIHNFIDNKIFGYRKKNAELRKNIISVKSFKTRMYAGDMLQRVVELLASKPFFSDLSFTFYGQGDLFYESIGSLVKYPNVRIYHKFLNPQELSSLYSQNGIVLNPTRHDTHGVSRDEAMACGLVPITNDIACVPEFVDSECGFIVPPEDAEAMAASIEMLYYNPELFLKMSENAANRVRSQCGFDRTIAREIELITL
ncbi:glycosyltransferase [Paenibacillus sp. YSY-4.3]